MQPWFQDLRSPAARSGAPAGWTQDPGATTMRWRRWGLSAMAIDFGSTFATYNYYQKNSAMALKTKAAEPIVKNDIAYFRANITKVKTVDEFVGNYRLFNFAMNAFGLSEMANAKAYMKKVLNSDLSDSSSFVNKLADDKFKVFARAFSNLNPTNALTTVPATADDVVGYYLNQSIETELGQTDQGVQLALYFKRNAATIKSAYSILGDPALYKVVKTVFNLPDNMGKVDIAQQKRIVDAKLNVNDLQDPTKVNKLLQRFAAIWDATNNTAANNPILTLFNTSSSRSSVSSGAASSIIGLKYGG
ncbi:protein of unknown function [Azorhizobium caulinodans ORS 571]|uniref:DUF1217 domain-containing protein n=2 Tax=Xanthobacteraceae TaxID=335928 RepID=A8I0E0_AZOC5|nr:protein of unknown function [Azorhizobium caulinodans ORS 571]